MLYSMGVAFISKFSEGCRSMYIMSKNGLCLVNLDIIDRISGSVSR
ncbi:MAG: hypothetical protein ACLVC1_13070 [Mediterraneibacter gnavus]